MTYTVHYKLDKSKTYEIKVSKKSTIQDLLEAVNEKHHTELKIVYSKNYSAYLDLDDSLRDWPPDEDDEVFYFSDQDELNPDLYESDEKTETLEKIKESTESSDEEEKPKPKPKPKAKDSTESSDEEEKPKPKPKSKAKEPTESSDEEEKPKPKPKPKAKDSTESSEEEEKPKPKPKSKVKEPTESSDEEEKPKPKPKPKAKDSTESSEEEEKPKPKPKSKVKEPTESSEEEEKPKPKPKPKAKDSTESSDEEEKPKPKPKSKVKEPTESSEEEEKPKPKPKPKAKESTESSDEEEKPKPKPKPKAKDSTESSDEEEKPKPKPKPKAKESTESSDEEEKPKPKPKPKAKDPTESSEEEEKPKPKPKPKAKDSTKSSEEEEKPKPKPKPKAKDPTESSEEEEKPKPKPKPKAKDPTESSEEEEKPKPKPKSKVKEPTESSEEEEKPNPKAKDPESSDGDKKSEGHSDDEAPMDYPEIPSIDYPTIPTIGKEKPCDEILQTILNNSFKMDLKPKHSQKDAKKNEFYIYSTQSYEYMTNPTKVKINLDLTYADVENEIRNSLDIKSKKQIHIFLPTGIPFTAKYGKKANKLENFFNKIESSHNLYVVITNEIDQDILNQELDEVCSVKNDEMKSLICPVCECTDIGYSRIACLLGTFYYKGLRTNEFIKSVARCTGFAPLVSFLSSILYHEPITGLMLATVTASLHTLFSKLLPKNTNPTNVFDRALECACYVVHLEQTFITTKVKAKKKQPNQIKIEPIDIDNDDKEGIVEYLSKCKMEGTFYQYNPDIDTEEDFEIAIIKKVPSYKEIEDIFNNYASFRPLPPLSTRTLNITCIVQYVEDRTILFVGDFDKEDSEETIKIIDPFVGKIKKANIEKLAEDVQKSTGEGVESLIDPDDVEELIVILFDTSGSMLSNYNDNKIAQKRKRNKKTDKPIVGDTDRFAIASQYLTTFLNRSFGFRFPHVISLISFGKEILVQNNFSPLSPNIEAAASRMKISGKSRVWDAIDLAITKLEKFNKDKKYPNARPRIIVFSDGIDSGSEKAPEEVCQRAIKKKITVDSVIISLCDSCANLCKFTHLTGGYALRSDDIKDVNALFEKEAFLSLKLRPDRDVQTGKITEKIFKKADESFDADVDNYDYITQTHRVQLSTPNFVMSKAKSSKKQRESHELRLLRELKLFQQKNDDTIKLYVNSHNINNWKVYIKGPKDSGYKKKWWFLSITFTEDYPLHPPLFRFITIPYHINISEDGRVCASFLFKTYRASDSVYDLLVKIQDLLSNPETESPIQIYKRMLYHDDEDEYNNKIEESCENAYKSVKEGTTGSEINDDKDFVADENDFENAEDPIFDGAADTDKKKKKKKKSKHHDDDEDEDDGKDKDKDDKKDDDEDSD